MDNILRNLESLSRTELVWLNTYLVGRPPENDSHPPVTEVEPHGSVVMQGPNGVTSQQGATVAPLPDRIEAFNSSLDPWERTGAVPQGWATHLRQAMVPIQGYIQTYWEGFPIGEHLFSGPSLQKHLPVLPMSTM